MQLKKRIDTVDRILEEFNDTQMRIQILVENEEETDERENFENKFYETLQKAIQSPNQYRYLHLLLTILIIIQTNLLQLN